MSEIDDITKITYSGGRKILTAQEVKNMEVGTKVILNGFDRYGEHWEMEMTIVKKQSGRAKELYMHSFRTGETIRKPIRENKNQWYTEAKKRK